ncbi:hypothetical protein D3C72_1390290 [compost metagenome]
MGQGIHPAGSRQYDKRTYAHPYGEQTQSSMDLQESIRCVVARTESSQELNIFHTVLSGYRMESP